MKPHITLIGNGSYGEFAKQVLLDYPVEFSQLGGRETVEALKKGHFDFGSHPTTHVYITTPNFTHFNLVKAALEAKKHVLCEKPLALTSREAEYLYKLAVANKRYLNVGFVLPHHPFYLWLQKAQRKFGPIRSIEVFNHATEGELKVDWYWDNSLSGGWFLVSEIHWYQLMVWLTGKSNLVVRDAWERTHHGRTVRTYSKITHTSTQLEIDHRLNMTQQTHWAKINFDFANGFQAVIDDWVPRSLQLSQAVQGMNFPDYIEKRGLEYIDIRPRNERYLDLIRHNIVSLLKTKKQPPLYLESILAAHKTAVKAQKMSDAMRLANLRTFIAQDKIGETISPEF